MDNIRKQMYLGALLHDIGKFYQRADKTLTDVMCAVSHTSRKLADDICPVNMYGGYSHQHVIWTNEFIDQMKEIFRLIPGITDKTGESVEDSFVNFACNHHKPVSLLQAIVTQADWWSAGIDRSSKNAADEDNATDGEIKWGKQRYKKIPLYSIFNKINGGVNRFAYPLKSLELSGTCFPYEVQSTQNGVDEQQYARLWEEFLKEFKKLPTGSFEGFTESLLFLLKKYTWCIPSNTMDMSDVSLVDHLKTTAAFVDCLYRYYEKNQSDFIWKPVDRRLSIKSDARPVLLVGGDISGIQKFIYNIASTKAAVSLKGRSFYLQLLIDSVIQRIIDHKDIKCTIGQVVYSSGGKFYMLLPNIDTVRKALDELKGEFEQELWRQHYGLLSINMGYVPFLFDTQTGRISFADKTGVEIGELWKYLADKLSKQKSAKFKSIFKSGYEEYFEPHEVGDKPKVCSVTGMESRDCVDLGNNTFVLKSVKEQADLGKTLKDADYILTYRGKGQSRNLSNKAKCDMCILSIHNYLFDQLELTVDDADFRAITSADVCRVKSINNCKFLNAPIKGHAVSYGFQFYGGNKQAQCSDGLRNNSKRDNTFEELADSSYLGILRMDVDNLGKIFINGLSNSSKSFSAYSTLSSMLDYFFSGYLNIIREKYKDHVNILYSGGDDVFALGRWDKLILFAEDVRSSFACFTGRNDITISGGIIFVNSKYPISKAALLAGDAEDAAKCNPGKNSLNLFGENISWNEEYSYVKSMKEKMVHLCLYEGMPRSILHKLMLFWQMKQRGDKSYIWNATYFLTRFSQEKKGAIPDFCNKLKTEICSQRKLDLISIAARWAELELRFE